MKTVTVNRGVLLAKVLVNRTAHTNEYAAAMAEYRKAAIAEYQHYIGEIQQEGKVPRNLSLPEPEDHTRDYDRAIDMLDMSVVQEIELMAHEFNQLVRDEWEWTDRAKLILSGYKTR